MSVKDEYARAWLSGESEWWPDHIELPDVVQIVRPGCPSSPMPELAQQRIAALRAAGETYVVHVSPGVHAYRIGPASDYGMARATGKD